MAADQAGVVVKYIFGRECGLFRASSTLKGTSRVNLKRRVQILLEEKAAAKGLIEKECHLKSHPKTTFIVTFSCDGRRMATLHGDHTIRIIDIATGRNYQTLVGHPRSPWTVEFHKTHPNILASGCLSGQIRIWDLSSGDCDIWHSPTQNTITSLALHPTDKILLIAEANNVYIWNWEHCTEPRLFSSSKRTCDKVRWLKFDYSGDWFYTGITSSAEFDSWNILRQAPSAFEINQLRQRSETAARARNQYQASLNANISLGEMLGNPLEISNDLLAQSGADARPNSNMDVYHAATTFAQLHRIHTGDSEEGASPSAEPANRSMANYLNSGRSPRRPTAIEHEQGRFSLPSRWSPSRSRSQSNTNRPLLLQQELANVDSAPGSNSSTVTQTEPDTNSTGTITRGLSTTTTSGAGSRGSGGGSGGASQEDSLFGISLSRALSVTQPLATSNPYVRSLATSRPPIRRPSNTLAVFEPNRAVEDAQQAERQEAAVAEAGMWSEASKVLCRLEGLRGPRRFSSSLVDLVSRLEALTESPDMPEGMEEGTRSRLMSQLHISLLTGMRRSSQPEELKERLLSILQILSEYASDGTSSDSDEPVTSPISAGTDAAADPTGAENSTTTEPAAATSSSQPTVTDSSTNTDPPLTRSFGVSTDDLRSSQSSAPNYLAGSGRQVPNHRQLQEPDVDGRRAYLGGRFEIVNDPVLRAVQDSIQCSMNRPQRIQRWRLDEKVENLDRRLNVIIHRCKIHNDAGIDISQDGTILAVIVKNPNTAYCPGVYRADAMLRLVSLREGSLGDVLYQIALGANPVSVSVSPLNGYVVVGLTGWTSNTEYPMIKYDIYKVPEEHGVRLKMARSVYTTRPDVPMAVVNCVKWLPEPGQGLVIGTNQGNVIIQHSTSSGKVNLSSSEMHSSASRGLFLQI